MDALRQRRRRDEPSERQTRVVRRPSLSLKAYEAVRLEGLAPAALDGEDSSPSPLHRCANLPVSSDCPGESDEFLDAALSVLGRIAAGCEEVLAGDVLESEAMLEETLAAFALVTDICARAGVFPLDQDEERLHEKKPQQQPTDRGTSWRFGMGEVVCCSDARDGNRGWPPALVAKKGNQDRLGDDWDDNSSIRSSQYDGDVDTQACASDEGTSCREEDDSRLHRLHLELDSLRERAARSDSAVVDVKQQLASTCERLERLEVTIRESNKSVERTVQDQARHWRAICDELVQDKRSLATQLAQERGRFAALKRHVDTRSSESQQQQHTRPATPTSPLSSPEALASDGSSSTSLNPSPRHERERNEDRESIERKQRSAKDERLANSFRRNYLSSSRGSR